MASPTMKDPILPKMSLIEKVPTIVDFMRRYLESIHLKKDTMSSLGSDSTSLLIHVGRHASDRALLHAKNLKIIGVHCICYQPALASTQISNPATLVYISDCAKD